MAILLASSACIIARGVAGGQVTAPTPRRAFDKLGGLKHTDAAIGHGRRQSEAKRSLVKTVRPKQNPLTTRGVFAWPVDRWRPAVAGECCTG